MKIALSGTELTPEEDIDILLAATRTVAAVGLELWYPKNLKVSGHDKTLAKIRASGVEVACVASPSELGREGNIDADEKMLVDAIELAAIVGSPHVNTYFGYRAGRDDHTSIETYCRNLQSCLGLAEKKGITICIENEFDSFGHDPAGSDPTRRAESIVALMESVSSDHFRLTFDPTNALIAGNDVMSFYNVVRPWIGCVHVKNCRRLDGAEPANKHWREFSDLGRRYSTCPLDVGEVPWKSLLDALVHDGYTGFLALEPHSETSVRNQAWHDAVSVVLGLLKRSRLRDR